MISPAADSPLRAFALLITLNLLLLLSSVALQCLRFYGEDGSVGQNALTFAFNVNREANIPTLVSAAQLLFCYALCREIHAALGGWRSPHRNARLWAALSLLFLLLAVEEVASFRSLVSFGLGRFFEAGGAFHFLWVIPGAGFAAGIALFFAGFVLRLPRRTSALISTAAALYLLGALGMEMVSGVWIGSSGRETFAYSLLTTAEEALEMLGVSLAALALLDYLERPEACAGRT